MGRNWGALRRGKTCSYSVPTRAMAQWKGKSSYTMRRIIHTVQGKGLPFPQICGSSEIFLQTDAHLLRSVSRYSMVRVFCSASSALYFALSTFALRVFIERLTREDRLERLLCVSLIALHR